MTAPPDKPDQGLVQLAPIVLGAVLAAVVLQYAFGGRQTDFGDLDLGINTATFFAQHQGQPIHVKDPDDAAPLFAAWEERGRRPVGLFLGNSQIHGINQYEEGQNNAAGMLFERFSPRGIDVLTFTQASANLQEHYIIFEYLLPRLEPKFLILPVVFMNQRLDTIRDGLAQCMRDAETRQELEKTAIGRHLLALLKDIRGAAGDEPENLQQYTERHLNDWLDKHWALWRLRPEARGQIASNIIRARNTVLRISGQSKRPMHRAAYDDNMAALAATLLSARDHGVKVLVYIAPIRQEIEPPFFRNEYDQCRQQVEQLAGEYGAVFADLGAIVPDEDFGYHNARMFFQQSQPDFFHFRATAHRRLADALGELIETRILNQ